MRNKIAAFLGILIVVTVGLELRDIALQNLPIDYDDDDYLGATIHYANALRAGDIAELINYEYNFEHPPLSKLFYGLAILPLPETVPLPQKPPSAPIAASLPEPHFHFARLQSVIFGTLEVLLLALVNPLAGLFLAIDTWQIKYTSQIMLEPLPSFTSLLAVFAYLKSKRRLNGWLLLSSAALGLTVAGKFQYGIIAIAILIDWIWRDREAGESRRQFWSISWFHWILVWGGLAVLVFFIANPRLWSDPVGRLFQAVQFHFNYARSDYVQQVGYPPWQPFVWLFQPVPWHPGVFLIVADVLITILAFLGFRRAWREERVFPLWLGLALVFLFFWPTKWPQYILMLTAPLCFCAAIGFQGLVWEPVRGWYSRRRTGKTEIILQGQPSSPAHSLKIALPWLLPGLLLLGLIAIYPMLFQGAMALTDFSAPAIKDGLNGGVWREVWLGLTGQVKPVVIDIFQRSTSKTVHYAGPSLLFRLIGGAAADLVVFSILWTVLAVSIQTALGVFVAVILNHRGLLFKAWWQVIYILPWAIPEFVGALIWAQVFDPRFGWFIQGKTWYETADYPGAINLVTNWQENPSYALVVLLVTATWYGFPFMMLVASAGLKMLPVEVYDAASMDGAGGWNTFRMVTWPLLAPLIVPAVIIRSIFSFNQFYVFYVLSPPYPVATFSITSFYFFDQMGKYGVSAALNLFTVLALVALIWWFNRWSKASQGVTYA